MISDRFIRNAKPGMYADEGGLYLQVYASGNKAFIHRTQVGSKQKKDVIGHYPAMGLADARAALAKRKSGHEITTVQEAFGAYYEHLANRYKRPELVKRIFDKDVLPKISAKRLDAVTRAELTALFRDVAKRGSPTMANGVLTKTKAFFSYCEQQGWIDRNPVASTMRESIGGRERPRDRVLTWDEISTFFKFLRGNYHPAATGTLWTLYLCLLTGLRVSEVLSFKVGSQPWMEGPAKSTPAGPVRYKVPLTPHVRAAMKFYTSRPTTYTVPAKFLYEHDMDFTAHDLRRTMSTRMADLGIAPHVVEKLLNHKMEGMMAIYNRAEYWDERVAAMKLWGRRLAEIRRHSSSSR